MSPAGKSAVLAALLSLAATVTNSAALPPLPTPASPRLYVFDCGTLVYNKPED